MNTFTIDTIDNDAGDTDNVDTDTMDTDTIDTDTIDTDTIDTDTMILLLWYYELLIWTIDTDDDDDANMMEILEKTFFITMSPALRTDPKSQSLTREKSDLNKKRDKSDLVTSLSPLSSEIKSNQKNNRNKKCENKSERGKGATVTSLTNDSDVITTHTPPKISSPKTSPPTPHQKTSSPPTPK